MHKLEKIIGILMLIFAVGFNLWLYRLEPTAKVDPNDNAFQFALVDRTNTMWDFAVRKCSSNILTLAVFPICHFSYLADHWVPNWAEGYNLPYYYSHIPQILIVGSWRVVSGVTYQVLRISQQCNNVTMQQCGLSLFQHYHIIIYLLLSLFPIPIFLALRVMRLPWLAAGVGAMLGTHLSTDGLYGLDPSSFLWRGYGLSSQLFAMIFLPLAIAFSYRFFNDLRFKIYELRINSQNFQVLKSYFLNLKSDYWLAVFFMTATIAGHLGIGMIAMLSLVPLWLAEPLSLALHQQSIRNIRDVLVKNTAKLVVLGGVSVFLLSYWIVPTFIHSNFHNDSFWDPVWKFNSYGWQVVMKRLLNGELFDWGRTPILTGLVILGGIVALLWPKRQSQNHELGIMNHAEEKKGGSPLFIIHNSLFPFSLLFAFWLFMYFGRATWGGLIDLIPGMKEYHLSRFIVGVHLSGMFLAPIAFAWLADSLTKLLAPLILRLVGNKKSTQQSAYWSIGVLGYLIIGLLLIVPVYQYTMTYNELNDRLIIQANNTYKGQIADEQALFAKLRNLPGARIFAGRGGSWGKRFQVAETPYFMNLSTYGLPTTMWLPETWSMNSDTEQYFSDDQAKDYDLYNIRWVAAPPDQDAQKFWELIDERKTWKLYEVKPPCDNPPAGEAGVTMPQCNNAAMSYFTTGIRPATVAATKHNFTNVVRLWIQSDMHKQRLFPELTFAGGYPKKYGLPNFRMVDEANYQIPDGSVHNLFKEPPTYLPPGFTSKEQLAKAATDDYLNIKLTGNQNNDTDMVFTTNVDVGPNCKECIVVLKHTYHPGWKAWVDGQPVAPMNVFPFYLAVPVRQGTHTVTFAYQPSALKVGLLVITLVAVLTASFTYLKYFKK